MQKAFCFFCVLSACISIALLFLTIFGGGWDDLGKLFFQGFLFSIAVLLGGLIWASGVDPSEQKVVLDVGTPPIVQSSSNKTQIELAKHLTSEGVVMYSAYWCPHCHDQKEMFGREAVKEIDVIECASDGLNNQRSLCENKGIEAFPSWEIDGIIDSGVKSLDELADLTEFKGSLDF